MIAEPLVVDPRIERTRAVVLDATTELLVDEGFEQITIEAIAERSGVARSTIYRNWPDRSLLLVEAFERLCAFEQIPDLGSVAAELRLLGKELVAGLNDREWGRALPSLLGAAAHDDDLERAQRAFSERRRTLVAPVFARAIERGEVSPGTSPADLAECFAAGFFFRALMSRQTLDDDYVEAQIERVMAIAAASA